ncbi:MAG: O-antigen ligase family protein [Candidatus Krumholzibacteriia bacterium]
MSGAAGETTWALRAGRAAPALLVVWLLAVPLSTAAAEILLAAAVVAALLARAAGPRPEIWPHGWRSPVTGGPLTGAAPWLWAAFIVWFVVSALAAVSTEVSIGKLPKLFRYALFFVPLAVPWRSRHWRAALWVQLPLLVALAWPALASMFEGWGRAHTDNLHYNSLAQVAATSSLLLLAGALYGPASARRERLLLLAACVMATALMIVTFSRAAWLAWWLAAVVLVLFRLPRRLALAAVAVMILVPLISLPAVIQRRPDTFDLQHPEFARRYDMWRMAVDIVRDHPWTGVGPGGIDAVYHEYKTGMLVDDPAMWSHVHNDLLEVALSHGLPAALIWAALAVVLYGAMARGLVRSRAIPGSWIKAGFLGAGASLHLFYLFGLVHDNYPIYVKSCLLLLLWGVFTAADRSLWPPAAPPAERRRRDLEATARNEAPG